MLCITMCVVPDGVIVSEVNDELPETIKPGMLLSAVNGTNVEVSSNKAVLAAVKEAGRPLTLKFCSTVEHMFLERLEHQFMEADADGSGALDQEEMA